MQPLHSARSASSRTPFPRSHRPAGGHLPLPASPAPRSAPSRARRFARLRPAVALFIALGAPAFLPAAPAAAEPLATDGVIFPRPAAPSGALAPRARTSSSWLLPLGLAAAAAGGWLLWRQRQAPAARSGRDPRKLAVTETRGLGNRQYLVVADYDGKKFLLGVTPGRIDLLAPLEDGSPRA